MDWRSYAVGAVTGAGSVLAFLVGVGIYALFELAQAEAAESNEFELREHGEPWRC